MEMGVMLARYASLMWCLAGAALLLIELATPGLFFFVSFAFGSLFGAALAYFGYPLEVQAGVVFVVSILQFTSMRRRLRRFNQSQMMQTNVHALVGKRGLVTVAIKPHSPGSVRLGGEVWSALCTQNKRIAVGTEVQVVRIEGNRVIVKVSEETTS